MGVIGCSGPAGCSWAEGPVELSAPSFEILDTLLSKPDEVVGKVDLLDIVWPGRVVEENTLQVHISALRKALPAAMIMTVHGRGYEYAGPKPVMALATLRRNAGRRSLFSRLKI